MKSNERNSTSSKENGKKIIVALISAIVLASVFGIMSMDTQPSYAASGSISLDPVVFSSNSAVQVLVNGGSFSSTSITFFISSSSTFSSKTSIGTYTLPSGSTSISNGVVRFTIPTETPGTYYIAASDDGGTTFTSSVPVTVSALTPSLSVSTTLYAGASAAVTGKGFDPGSSVDIYLNYASGSLLAGNVNAATGSFSTSVTVPTTISQTNNPYYVVAQESSPSSPNYGITADSKAVTINAAISVSPVDIAPSASSSVTITGYGFAASATVSATSISMSASGTISSISYSAFTTSSTGSFSVPVSFDSSLANGPVTVTITTSPSSSPSSFTNAFYISQPNPSNLGFSFSDLTTGTSTAFIGDSVSGTVYNFPASQTVSIYLGPILVGNAVTDSNGFAQLTSSIPPFALPSTTNSFTPTAETQGGLYATGSAITLDQSAEALDTSGNALTTGVSEYVPVNATVVVKAFGLTPSTSYDLYDSIAAPSGAYASGLVTSIPVGSVSASGMNPASNGTLIFSYFTFYKKSGSSTSSTITLKTSSGTSIPGYGGLSFGYDTVVAVTISSPSSFSKMTPGISSTLTVANLIPVGSTVYPGVSYYYNAYIGNSELTLTSSGSSYTQFYSTSSTFTGSFTVPSVSGLVNISVTYAGEPVSSSIGSSYVIVSSPGSSAGSGTLTVVPTSSGYEIVGYGYLDNPSLYYMTYSGKSSLGTQTVTGSNYGAFAASISPGSQPSGSYAVFTVVTVSGASYFVYSSYTVSPSVVISSPLLPSGAPGGTAGSSVSASASGLQANTFYYVYFSSMKEETILSSSTGSITSISFAVPPVRSGDYSLYLIAEGSSSVAASARFTVVNNTNIYLGTSSEFAFPGELVQFSVSDMGSASLPGGFTSVSGATPTYSVTVSLNGTDFVTVPASLSAGGVFNGSFQMPNSNPGSYYLLTFSANETVLASYSASTYTYYETVKAPFSKTQSTFLGLISGNGAYILGISQNQIAEIDSSINATLSVPISQLNAAITSINGNVATLVTEFGTMNASLKSINANVSSINSGVATVVTTLGTVKTSLSSLNATLIALNNDTATISTSLGKFNATLSNINASVSIANGNIATIKTDLGTFTGNVTSVSNGIATIQTKLGTIEANTNQIVPPYGMSFLLEIVILILVVIALVFSALAMLNTRKRF